MWVCACNSNTTSAYGDDDETIHSRKRDDKAASARGDNGEATYNHKRDSVVVYMSRHTSKWSIAHMETMAKLSAFTKLMIMLSTQLPVHVEIAEKRVRAF